MVSATAVATSSSSPIPAARSSASAGSRDGTRPIRATRRSRCSGVPGLSLSRVGWLPRRPDSGADQAEPEDQGGDADNGAEDRNEGGKAEGPEPGQEGENSAT